ncbi:peptide deformylase [Desulfohalobium retbaense]|uniref:Peptide deformylase n=1 Tax=Desulfohalobium retbaense (strain ATCC 49708 / DSM 5692 / JCM 16813 / HR100) TaxID=485915 RepID=C8WZ42_DESRD|nr:peptide deformylase [Desulfohalobium retbaense]ACV67317.1 peptide deformylase [Desulfohalobium retbaense DSM 5692]
MTLSICTYPDPVLARRAEPVAEISEEVRQLASDMVETMYANQGIGLAAPQVGKSWRLITVDISGPENQTELVTLVNPEIQWRDGETETEEGCLSVPEFRSKVQRAAKVRVTGQDLDGNAVDMEADGLLAVCLQHEIDHLEGTIILDHVSRLKRSMYTKKVSKWQKQD